MTSIDRRKHPRVTVSVDVDFESGSNFYSGKARDMSEGGVFVETFVFAPVGTRIELSLKLFGHRYEVPVEVMWILYDGEGTAVGFGARFLELRRPVRRVITEFMRARAPMPFELLEMEDDVEETGPPGSEGPSGSPEELREAHTGPPPLPAEESPLPAEEPPPLPEEPTAPQAAAPQCWSGIGAERPAQANARRRRSTLRFAARRARVGPPPLPVVAGGPRPLEKTGADVAGAGVESDRMVN